MAECLARRGVALNCFLTLPQCALSRINDWHFVPYKMCALFVECPGRVYCFDKDTTHALTNTRTQFATKWPIPREDRGDGARGSIVCAIV